MAVLTDPCTLSTLTTESPCVQCLPASQKAILAIWAMAQTLKLLNGADYTNVNDLSTAVKCFKCEPQSTLDGFEAQEWIDVAVKAGLTLGGTPESVTTEFNALFKCWRCLDPQTVKAAHTLLLCKLIAKLIIVL